MVSAEKDALQFLATLRSCKSEEEESKKTIESILEGCLAEIKQGPSISMAEASQMLQEVRAAEIPDWMKQSFTKQVEQIALSSIATPQGSTRTAMQRHMRLHHFATKKDGMVFVQSQVELGFQNANPHPAVCIARPHLLIRAYTSPDDFNPVDGCPQRSYRGSDN